MPIRPFLAGRVFDDDVVAAMGAALDRACRTFALVDKQDAVTNVVAQKIIEAASAGERDPDKLYEAVWRWATQCDGPGRHELDPQVKMGEER